MNDDSPPMPTLLDVERAISVLRHALDEMRMQPGDPWLIERALSLDRVLAWLELELGPLVAELGGLARGPRASDIEVPPVDGIRRVLLERIGSTLATAAVDQSRREFTPSDLGELGGTTSVVVDVPAGFVPDCGADGKPLVFTNRGDVAVTFSGGMVGTIAPPARELAERLHELGEVTPEEGRAISARAFVDAVNGGESPTCSKCGQPFYSREGGAVCFGCRVKE